MVMKPFPLSFVISPLTLPFSRKQTAFASIGDCVQPPTPNAISYSKSDFVTADFSLHEERERENKGMNKA